MEVQLPAGRNSGNFNLYRNARRRKKEKNKNKKNWKK